MVSRVSRAPARRGRRLALLAAALGAALAGCGPIVYVSQVHDASDAIDTARAAQAEKYAPYWWTRATQYLQKAREIAAYADFQGANRFGLLATEAAEKATEEAKLAERDPSKRPLDLAPDVAPAKDAAPAKDVAPAPSSVPLAVPAKQPPAKIAPAKDAP
jgi:hypothetical protein